MDREIIEDFENFLWEKMGNEKTIKEYVSSVRQLPGAIFSRSDKEMIKFLNSRIKKYPTRLYYKFSYKYFLEFLGKMGMYKELANPPRASRKIKRKFISFMKIKKLVDSCEDEELSLIMMIQFVTAARISEILETTFDDIDYDGKYATLTMRVKKKRSRVEDVTRYLDEPTTERFKKFIEARKRIGRIFTLSYHQVWKKEVELSEKVLKKRVTPHWFRGSRAVQILRTLKNIIEAKEALAHDDIRSTEVYLKQSGIGSKRIMENVKTEW